MTDDERKNLFRQFYDWVLAQENPQYQLIEKKRKEKEDHDTILLDTTDGEAEVGFYPMEIILLSVRNKHIDRHVFFLHFQIQSMEHAQELFQEMAEALLELKGQPEAKILLSCTSGLTTSFFAEKLNEAAKLLGLNYSFHAVSYDMLYQKAGQYDMVLLAPQIAYAYDQAKKILAHRHVLKIPPKIFASYHAAGLLDMIQPYLDNSKDTANETPKPEEKSVRHGISPGWDKNTSPPMRNDIEIRDTTLVIALIWENDDRFHFASRVYGKNQDILYNADTLKLKIDLKDLYDICDIALAKFPEIEVIGLSMPGIINNGQVTIYHLEIYDADVTGMLEKRYGKKVVLGNDANCIAAGYYATQTEYSSISLFFQPIIGLSGGVGSIYRGQLITGRRHVAGEVQYLPIFNDKEKAAMWRTPEGALRLTTETMASIISILGPDLILLASHMIFSTEGIRRELAKNIPECYLPDIKVIRGLREYMLTGMAAACHDARLG